MCKNMHCHTQTDNNRCPLFAKPNKNEKRKKQKKTKIAYLHVRLINNFKVNLFCMYHFTLSTRSFSYITAWPHEVKLKTIWNVILKLFLSVLSSSLLILFFIFNERNQMAQRLLSSSVTEQCETNNFTSK